MDGGEAEGESEGETVAVTVTCGGPGSTPPAEAEAEAEADAPVGESPPCDTRNSSSGARATPSAAEARTSRRGRARCRTRVRDPARGRASGSAVLRPTYAVPPHGSSPSASAGRGVSRSAHSSSWAAAQCGQRTMWACRSVLARGLSGRTDSSMRRRKSAQRESSEAARRSLRHVLGQGLQGPLRAVDHVLAGQAQVVGGAGLRLGLHQAVPDEALGAGRQGLEGR